MVKQKDMATASLANGEDRQKMKVTFLKTIQFLETIPHTS
jgi:hypothetical protein